jgi:DNA transformation protein and related proteins
VAGDPHRFDDLFQEFGPVRLRRFFGGEGIYAGDVMIGAIFRDVIYFKTDDQTRPAFDAEGCKAFTFMKGGEEVVTSWRAIPDRLYDEPDELAVWARAALGMMTRMAAAKPAKKKAARPAKARRA